MNSTFEFCTNLEEKIDEIDEEDEGVQSEIPRLHEIISNFMYIFSKYHNEKVETNEQKSLNKVLFREAKEERIESCASKEIKRLEKIEKQIKERLEHLRKMNKKYLEKNLDKNIKINKI